MTGGNLAATEWNQVPSELQNVIEALGQVLSAGDLDQLGKAVAGYVGAGDYYAESGAADAYVASPVGGKQGPPVLGSETDGLLVRFRPGNANTGASTLNVNGLGAKALVREDTSALQAGDLSTGRDAVCRYDAGSDHFRLLDFALSAQVVTAVPQGYIDGFRLANNGTDPTNDVDFNPGIARDDGDALTLELTSQLTKQLDATFAAGNDAGGLFTGTIAADTWYHCFVIRRTSDGLVDCGFDTSATASNIPSGWANPRRVGAIRTGAGPAIRLFTQFRDYFQWTNPFEATDATAVTTQTFDHPGLPTVVSVLANLSLVIDSTSTERLVVVHGNTVADASPSYSATPGVTVISRNQGGGVQEGHANVTLLVTDQEIRHRANADTDNLHVHVRGWTDLRGQSA